MKLLLPHCNFYFFRKSSFTFTKFFEQTRCLKIIKNVSLEFFSVSNFIQIEIRVFNFRAKIAKLAPANDINFWRENSNIFNLENVVK